MTGWAATNTLRGLIGAKTCGHPMQGIYGADSACARPAGHAGKHDTIWNWQDWGHDALALVETALDAAEPMANLPFPVSSRERDIWRTNQERLAAALRAVREGASRGCAACEGDPEAHGLHVCGRDGAS